VHDKKPASEFDPARASPAHPSREITMRISARAVFLDASAIIAYHVDEPRSEVLRKWWNEESTKYTSPLCFFESLNAYKSKWLFRAELNHDQYRKACFDTYLWYQAAVRHVTDMEFNDHAVFQEAYLLALKHSMDLSDAFQVLSVKSGYFSVLANDSKTILCTGDAALAAVARSEGLKAWDFKTESPPI
jgi:predicted nucleic acid-binding protein